MPRGKQGGKQGQGCVASRARGHNAVSSKRGWALGQVVQGQGTGPRGGKKPRGIPGSRAGQFLNLQRESLHGGSGQGL